MSTGAHTIDLAQIVLYGFWIFFAGLIYYLHRENKREGYPLESDGRRGTRVRIQGFPAIPLPKTYRLRDGQTRTVPRESPPEPRPKAEPTSRVPGSPLEPTGNAMLDGVGPGAYAHRPDVPDTTIDGQARIVPLRRAIGFSVHPSDPDPRGLPVVGADRVVGGVVRDLWVDRSEVVFRYLEVEVAAGGATRHVLLPVNFARIESRRVDVSSILGAQFAQVPATQRDDQITLLEEERITAYYGAGTLFAEPSRREPLL